MAFMRQGWHASSHTIIFRLFYFTAIQLSLDVNTLEESFSLPLTIQSLHFTKTYIAEHYTKGVL